MVSPEALIFAIVVAFTTWLIIGSMLGRAIMRRKVKTCLENRGKLKILTPSSALVELEESQDMEYMGIYIDWLPFDNIINLPLRFITRPRPIAIIKIQPRKPVQGQVSLTARSRAEALKGNYKIIYKNVSKERLDRIVEEASKRGFEKVVIDVKPNITIVTTLREDCQSLATKAYSFAKELS